MATATSAPEPILSGIGAQRVRLPIDQLARHLSVIKCSSAANAAGIDNENIWAIKLIIHSIANLLILLNLSEVALPRRESNSSESCCPKTSIKFGALKNSKN